MNLVADNGGHCILPFAWQEQRELAEKRRRNIAAILLLYSDEELKEFILHIQSSAKRAKVTYVMFNNCHGGFAMRNAEMMKALIKE